MTPEEALEVLDGGLVYSRGKGWTKVPEFVEEEMLEAWARFLGNKEFENRVRLLKQGHTVPSPVCPEFQYRIAGLAGRQQDLGIT